MAANWLQNLLITNNVARSSPIFEISEGGHQNRLSSHLGMMTVIICHIIIMIMMILRKLNLIITTLILTLILNCCIGATEIETTLVGPKREKFAGGGGGMEDCDHSRQIKNRIRHNNVIDNFFNCHLNIYIGEFQQMFFTHLGPVV